MKALTVQQPWTWAIFNGKDVENRTWTTTHRGQFAIHAGGRISARGAEIVPQLMSEQRGGDGFALYLGQDQYSAVLGLVDLVDTHLAGEGCCDSPWGEQAYEEHPTSRTRRDIHHWELANPLQLARPVPCPGRQQLWNLGNDVVDQIREQLGTAAQ